MAEPKKPDIKPDAANKPADTTRTLVQFTKPAGNYSPGDIAGFSADKAAQLVDKHKVAKRYVKGE